MRKAVSGGSGWALLTWSYRDGWLVNTSAADHTITLADGAPLPALDLYEHTGRMHYGAKAGAYVYAFVEARNEAFRRAAA